MVAGRMFLYTQTDHMVSKGVKMSIKRQPEFFGRGGGRPVDLVYQGEREPLANSYPERRMS